RLPTVRPRSVARRAPAAATDAWSPEETFAPAAQLWKRQIQDSGAFRTRPAATSHAGPMLRVHTVDPAASQPIVERILGEQARRWALVGIMRGDGGDNVTLKYEVRLPKQARGPL